MEQSDPIEINDICYRLNHTNKTAEVTIGVYCYNVQIPEYIGYNGERYDVISIGNSAFKDSSLLESVILPKSIRTISEKHLKVART